MAGLRRQQKLYKTSAEALTAVMEMPSGSESEDSEEDDDEGAEGNEPEFEIGSDVEVEPDTDDDNDDDVLYRLPTSDSATDSDRSGTSHPSSDSDEEAHSPWSKTAFHDRGLDFDRISVVPQVAFSPDDGPVDFFRLLFNEYIFAILTEQTNIYAKQKNCVIGTRHRCMSWSVL